MKEKIGQNNSCSITVDDNRLFVMCKCLDFKVYLNLSLVSPVLLRNIAGHSLILSFEKNDI